MAGTQHYSLRWNNHQSHVLNAFDSLLQNEALVDCTLVCEDTSIRAHKVVLSACSPYFQKIFTDNPCKHPIIVLKDVRGWEVQCIVDFMYKGETSVPEAQLTSLIKAAEGLKVRGLTSSDQSLPVSAHSRHSSRHNSPMPNSGGPSNGFTARSVHYSPSPARYAPSNNDEPHAKVPHLTGADQSSPMSLTAHDPDARRSAEDRCSASSASARASPGPPGSGPRRKQARPRRRSGDSIGNASLDLSKADSPPFRKSPSHLDDVTPENLSMKRPSSSPAINLVKTESLMEDGRQGLSDNISEASSSVDRVDARALAAAAAAAASVASAANEDHPTTKPSTPSNSDHFLSAFHGNGLHQQEHEARVEALQALNYMARGMGLPPLPPHGHPLAGHPGVNGAPHLAGPHHVLTSSASGVIGRPTSTPSTGTNAFNVRRELLESLVPLKKKRRRSLSQLIPAETLSQFLLNLPSHAASQVNNAVANKLNNNDSEERMKNGVNTTGLLFGTPSQSLGAPPPASNTTHGTSAGFCNICQKFVSNRTNHKYVHSQVKFKCKICGYLYSRKDTLKDHIRGKHNPRYSTSDLNGLVEVVPPSAAAVANSTSNVNGRRS